MKPKRRSPGFRHRLLARISHTHGRRKGSTRRGTTAGTAWNAGLRPAQPAAGGRREGLPVPRWRRPGGNLSVRRDAYMGVADTVCRTCLRSVKADGKERPATLGVVQSSPTGKNPHDRVLRTAPQEENGWHLRWPGAASSSLVSRSRACRPEASPVLLVGAPGRPCHCAFGYTPSDLLGGTCRDGSHSGDWGLRRRGPAGRCAGRRPAFQAVPAMAPSALRALGLIRAVGVRSRLLFTATGGSSVSPIHTPSRRSVPALHA